MIVSGNDHRQRLPVYHTDQKVQAPFPIIITKIFFYPLVFSVRYRKIADEIDFSKGIFFWKNHWFNPLQGEYDNGSD